MDRIKFSRVLEIPPEADRVVGEVFFLAAGPGEMEIWVVGSTTAEIRRVASVGSNGIAYSAEEW